MSWDRLGMYVRVCACVRGTRSYVEGTPYMCRIYLCTIMGTRCTRKKKNQYLYNFCLENYGQTLPQSSTPLYEHTLTLTILHGEIQEIPMVCLRFSPQITRKEPIAAQCTAGGVVVWFEAPTGWVGVGGETNFAWKRPHESSCRVWGLEGFPEGGYVYLCAVLLVHFHDFHEINFFFNGSVYGFMYY